MSAAPAPHAVDVQRADVGGASYGHERPTKRARHGKAAVERTLQQTAEIVMVLAGMSQMRAGRPPGDLERDLAAKAFQNLGNFVARVSPAVLLPESSVESLIEELGLRKTVEKKRDVDKKDHHVAGAAEEMQKCVSSMAEATAAAMFAISNAPAAGDGACAFSTEEKDMDVAFSQTELSEPVNSAGLSALQDDGDDSDDGADSDMYPASPPPMPGLQSGPSELSPGLYAQAFNEAIAHQEGRSMLSTGLHGMVSGPPSKDMMSSMKSYAGFLPNTPRPIGRPRKDGLTGFSLFRPMNLPADQDACSRFLGLAVQQYFNMKNSALRVAPVVLSNAYMSSPVPCKVCKVLVKDVQSALICDSCELAYHMKCLQAFNVKVAPKGDWECPKCVKLNRGRPQTPKYGPTRKAPPRTPYNPGSDTRATADVSKPSPLGMTSFGASAVMKTFTPVPGEGKPSQPRQADPKVSLGKDLDLEEVEADQGESRSAEFISKDSKQAQGAPSTLKIRFKTRKISESGKEEGMARIPVSDGSVRDVSENLSPSPVLASNGGFDVRSNPLSVRGPSRDLSSDSSSIMASCTPMHSPSGGGSGDAVRMSLDRIQGPQPGFEEVQGKAIASKLVGSTSQKSKVRPSTEGTDVGYGATAKPGPVTTVSVRLDPPVNSLQNTDQPGTGEAPDEVVQMEWFGDVLHEADGQAYYGACRVGEHVFKVGDYALFRPESADVAPYIARLQTLWEDRVQHSKWVKVNWCYYPADIPVVVGRPSEPEPDEVYESNHCDNNLLGSIQGPCQVLTPVKFRKEREKRTELLKRDPLKSKEMHPIYVCRWVYDAPRGTFGLAAEELRIE